MTEAARSGRMVPSRWRSLWLQSTGFAEVSNGCGAGARNMGAADGPHWFGGRIPAVPESVEFVQVAATAQTIGYRRFAGNELLEDHPAASVAALRTSFILGLTPARLP
jgi:hypothetical protein